MSAHPLDPANVVLLAGTVSGPARRRTLPSGDELVEFDVTTRGPAGTRSAPVAWFSPGAIADALEPGSAVFVAGVVRRRFFRAGTGTQSRTEVVAARVVAATSRPAVKRLLADVARSLADAAPT